MNRFSENLEHVFYITACLYLWHLCISTQCTLRKQTLMITNFNNTNRGKKWLYTNRLTQLWLSPSISSLLYKSHFHKTKCNHLYLIMIFHSIKRVWYCRWSSGAHTTRTTLPRPRTMRTRRSARTTSAPGMQSSSRWTRERSSNSSWYSLLFSIKCQSN